MILSNAHHEHSDSLPMVSCGVAVSKLLEQRGVDVIFGIPGNHTLELYRGLDNSSIRHITSRHEQGAAFMADGYARASGRVGVCFLISGPGLLNAATAIAQARADSVPMLIITAVASRVSQGKGLGQLHELPDQQAAARGFCQESLSLQRAEDLPMLLDYAFKAFASRRPGPIHLQIPLDLMTSPIDLSLLPAPEINNAQGGSSEEAFVVPDPVLDCLQRATQLLVVLGGGAVPAGRKALVALAELLDAPVVQTTNAKGLIPVDHLLFVGGSPSLPGIQQALNSADVILAIGTEFAETDYDLLMAQPLALAGQLVRVDIDPIQVTRNQQPDHALVGGADAVVGALLQQLANNEQRQGAPRAAALREAVHTDPHYHREMAQVFATLQHIAPNMVLVGDSTRPTYYATWQYESPAPRHYFHSVSGFGTLGYAIPAAIGAAIGTEVAGDAPVVALIGDGGAQFSLPELATAMDNQIAVTFVIWCNRGYEEIENSLQGRGVSNRSTDISSPDFALIGSAYGMTVYQPRDWDSLAKDFASAIAEQSANLLLVQQEDFLSAPSGQWY